VNGITLVPQRFFAENENDWTTALQRRRREIIEPTLRRAKAKSEGWGSDKIIS
jgi:hypothetical protein